MRLDIDPGTEKWVPWAKRLLERLTSLRKLLRLETMNKAYQPEGGTTVFVHSAESADFIRIVGGVEGRIAESIINSIVIGYRVYHLQGGVKGYTEVGPPWTPASLDGFGGPAAGVGMQTSAYWFLGSWYLSRKLRDYQGFPHSYFQDLTGISEDGTYVYGGPPLGTYQTPDIYKLSAAQLAEESLPKDQWSTVTDFAVVSASAIPTFVTDFLATQPVPQTLGWTSPGYEGDVIVNMSTASPQPYYLRAPGSYIVRVDPVHDPYTDTLYATIYIPYVAAMVGTAPMLVYTHMRAVLAHYDTTTDAWVQDRVLFDGPHDIGDITIGTYFGTPLLDCPTVVQDSGYFGALSYTSTVPYPDAHTHTLPPALVAPSPRRALNAYWVEDNIDVGTPLDASQGLPTLAARGRCVRSDAGVLVSDIPGIANTDTIYRGSAVAAVGDVSCVVWASDGTYWWSALDRSFSSVKVLDNYLGRVQSFYLSPDGHELLTFPHTGLYAYWRDGVQVHAWDQTTIPDPATMTDADLALYGTPPDSGFWFLTGVQLPDIGLAGAPVPTPYAWSQKGGGVKATVYTSVVTTTVAGPGGPMSTTNWSTRQAQLKYDATLGSLKVVKLYSDAAQAVATRGPLTENVPGVNPGDLKLSEAQILQNEYIPQTKFRGTLIG